MLPMFLVPAIGCGLCLLAMPAAKRLATRFGLVDHPDGRRKIHGRPVPLAGGLAILVCASATLAAAPFILAELPAVPPDEATRLLGLLLAAVLICTLGVADDYGCLRGRHKLVGQVLVAVLLVTMGWEVRAVGVGTWQVELGVLALPLTVLWLIAAVNALNLLDGMDGLLGTVGLILCAALAAIAAAEGRLAAAGVAMALGGTLLGFLYHNRPPATAFLGDAGSMLVGLVVGALAVHGGTGEAQTLRLAVPLALLTVPFFDTTAAVLRRTLTGRSIYTTDRGHLHHCLLRRGCSPPRALAWVAVLCLLSAGGAVAAVLTGHGWLALLGAGAAVATPIATRRFGHAELALVYHQVARLAGSVLRWRRPARVEQTAVRLQGSAEWGELWANLIAWSARLHLRMVRLNVNAPALHEGYHARWDCAHTETEESTLWRADIPLTVDGQSLGRLEIIGERNGEPVLEKLATVLELVHHFEAEASELIRDRVPRPAGVRVSLPGPGPGDGAEADTSAASPI